MTVGQARFAWMEYRERNLFFKKVTIGLSKKKH